VIIIGLSAILGIFVIYAYRTPVSVRKDSVVTQYVYDDEEDWWGPLPWSVGWTGWYNGWWRGERTRPGPGPRPGPHSRPGGGHSSPRPGGGHSSPRPGSGPAGGRGRAPGGDGRRH
jgi:hypothetical protein